MKIETTIDGKIPDGVKMNYAELSEEVKAMVDQCSGGDAEAYASAKENRATLNKILKAVSEEYTSTKKQLLSPLDAKTDNGMSYTEMVNDIEKTLTNAIDSLSETIKKYEDARKKEKEQEINAIVREELAKSKYDLVRQSKAVGAFVDECKKRKSGSWLNATVSETSIRRELSEFVAKCDAGMDSTKAVYSDRLSEDEMYAVCEAFAEKFDPFDAQARYNKFMDEKRKVMEQAQDMKRSVITEPASSGQSVYMCTIRFVGTETAFANLREYLDVNNGLTYKVIEKMAEVK